MSLSITQPYPIFTDLDGRPLDNGYVWIGTANANPVTSQITVYWDSGMTQPVAQPMRTLNGYIARNGTPATVYTSADSYSMLVKNQRQVQTVYAKSVATASLASVAAAAASAAAAAISETNAAASAAAAAASAASVVTQAQLEDYLAKMRVPIGLVVPMPVNSMPYGYLECNGAAISRSTYSDLFAVIGTTYGVGDGSTTFNIPDMRGEFMRGWDHGRGVDSGRAIGSAQSYQNEAHTHGIAISGGTDGVVVDDYGTGTSKQGRGFNSGTVTTNLQVLSVSQGGAEARPRSIAMMYCIKAFDAPLQQTPPHEVKTEAGTTRTLALADANSYIRCTANTAITITVPTNASVAFPIDTEIDLFMAGIGTVSVVAAGGVTINAAGLSISGLHRAATLKKVGADEWDFIGALS
jgi:microcystin-dependent protein